MDVESHEHRASVLRTAPSRIVLVIRCCSFLHLLSIFDDVKLLADFAPRATVAVLDPSTVLSVEFLILQHRFTTSNLALPGYMPKTVSWDDKENIRFINRVGHQKKVRRHRKMSKSTVKTKEVACQKYIESLRAKIVEVVAEKDQKIAEVVAEKNQKIAEKDLKIMELEFQLSLERSSPSRKSSESSDSANMSVDSTTSGVSDMSLDKSGNS
jgi:hypothetical protein